MEKIVVNTSLTSEFQTCTWKLLIYNLFIVLLIANQNVTWNLVLKDSDLGNILGLIEPTVLTKFGFFYRLLTVIMNTLSVATVLQPKRETRHYLLPCIIWNLYTITAISENMFELIWSMILLEVPFRQFISIIFAGLFMLAFQTKLSVQIIRFYEFLNYAKM